MDNLIFATSGRTVLTEVGNGIQRYLPETEAAHMPEQMQLAFLMAQEADLSNTWPQLAQWIVCDSVYGVGQYAQEHQEIIRQIATLFQRFINGERISDSDWMSAAELAYLTSWERVDIPNYTAYEAMYCASKCAETMSQQRREENFLCFDDDKFSHRVVVSLLQVTACNARGEAWASQTIIALRNELFKLIWQAF